MSAAPTPTAPAFPAKLTERLRGRPLAVADTFLSAQGSGVSLIGAKTLVLTDRPAVYLHDAGGFLVKELVLDLDLPAPARAAFWAAKDGTVLRGTVRFGDGVQAQFEAGRGVAEVSDLLAGWLPPAGPEVRFRTPLPVGVRCRFDRSNAEIRTHLAATERDLVRLANPATHWADIHPELAARSAPAAALIEHLGSGEVTADVVVEGRRLRLLRADGVLADVPVDHLAVEAGAGRQVKLAGKMMVAGLPATAVTVHLPGEKLAGRLRRALAQAGHGPRPGGDAPSGVSELVHVAGRHATGRPFAGSADAVLSDDALELRAADTGRPLARFAFADPAVVVAGTADRFVIAGPGAGPVAVSGGADQFRQRLVRHDAVRAAARRAEATGPYPAFRGDDPVVCRLGGDGLEVDGAAGTLAVPFGEVRTVGRDAADGREGLAVATAARPALRLTGEREVLAALSAALHGRLFARAYAGRPADLANALLGLEGDYFLYSVFGPLYELHAALGRRADPATLLDPLPAPETTGDFLTLAGAMAQGLEPVRAHLDKAAYYLPSLVAACDARVLDPAPRAMPPWLKAHERGYRAVLAGVAPVAAELRGMREVLLRVRGVEARLKRAPDYGAAGLSLALGAAFFPMMLVSAVNQGVAISRQADRAKEELTDDARQAVERVVGQWNYLVREFLPPLAHHLLDGLFLVRVQFYAKAREQLTAAAGGGGVADRLARRLATLTTFAQYPEGGSALTRGAVAGAAREHRDRLTYAGFLPF